MTASESTTRVVSDSGNDIGPGQRLREAREAAKLSLAEVSSRMRLEPQVLELLESDHYEHLHGPTFVRGYLSGYARLLDLPERPILEAYERHDHRPPALVSELGRKPEVHVSDFPVRMVTYVIAGLLVVLVVLWWQSRQLTTHVPERAETAAESIQPLSAAATEKLESATPDEPGSQAPESADAGAASAQQAETTAETGGASATAAQAPAENMQSAALEPAPMPFPSASATAADPATALEPAAEQTTQASTQTDTQASLDTAGGAAGAQANQPAQESMQASAESDASQVSATDAASPPEEQAVQAPRPAPLPGSDRLAIQLARESWVEIYDRGGGRLYYSLAREGSEIVVEGAGPMRVLLGDIEGAAVAYNGEPFDLTRYQGRSVVRFTVGELSDTAAPPPPAATSPSEPLTRENAPAMVAPDPEPAVANAGDALISATPVAKSVPQVVTPPPPPQTRVIAVQPDS